MQIKDLHTLSQRLLLTRSRLRSEVVKNKFKRYGEVAKFRFKPPELELLGPFDSLLT